MAKPSISEATRRNWQWAFDRWAERDAREWAGHKSNPSVADHMYGQGPKRLSNAERLHVSPLDGRAK